MFSVIWTTTYGKRFQELVRNETDARFRFETIMRDRDTVDVTLFGGNGDLVLDEAHL